jgi:Transglycosylase SLT domain
VTQLVDTEEAAGLPPSDALTLVGETKSFLKDWQRVLLGSADWVPEQVADLRKRSRELESRARAADVSGLAQHLQSCELCFWNGEIDREKLAHCLRNVSEVAWQWRQALRQRSEFALDGHGHVPHDRLTIDPPTLLAPPSVEMFESSPPPEESTSEWREPPSEPRARPPLLGHWLGAGANNTGATDAPSDAAPPPRRKGAGGFPSLADAVYADAAPDSEPPEASSHEALPPRRSSPGAFPWWSASLGVLGVVGIGILVATFGGPEREVGPAGQVVTVSASSAPPKRLVTPAPRTLGRDVIDRLLGAAHGYGGIESPELAAWLDEEAAELSNGSCAPPAPGCALLQSALEAPPSDRPRARALPGERASWLEGFEVPAIGAEDEPRVREVFEFHTRNSVGREAFQELLFRCGLYREPIQAELDRYGLPRELLALPMVASGCVPDVESAAGGRGLWQLTPAAAKAYHLRVKAQIVDERIDPLKGTDAAVRLLEDLYRKTGSWALALAAYQLGPLALLSRLHDAGEDARYSDLDAAGALPPEVRQYVPSVQAFALVLANLAAFRFEPAPPRSPEGTAVLEVPPGTRLGQVARAAASSTIKIRELNPDLIGDRVPDWPGERFLLRVPKDAELRAREYLPQLIATADHADECVPHAFDWGRQRFTSAMASRCEHGSTR